MAFSRFMLIVAFFSVWMLGIAVRLVHLQVTQHSWLKEQAIGQRQDVKKTKLLRGTIYDRDNRALAMSVRVKSLYADPFEITDVTGAAKALARTLKLDGTQLARQIDDARASGKHYVSILKKVDEETVQKLNRALDTPDIRKSDQPQFAGLHWSEDQVRSYPNGSLAAQVIGFSNLDDSGMAGIEQSQDEILHGAVIRKLQERDRLGRVYGETTDEREQPGDVALTIGTSFQYKTEQALENGVKAANARSGMAVAIAVKTGEILAMANYPTFDPNVLKNASQENITNRAIQSSYSPGSTFKLVTYASALEKKLFQPDDMIDAGNGTITVANHKFSDSHHVGSVSYAQALAHSSNVCAIKTGLRAGKDDFWATLQKLGFGGRTGVELPAETSGIVRSPDRWNGDSLASMSIGYEIGVTALQMASAFATIANDGVRIQPHIIKEIRRPDQAPAPSDRTENTRVVSIETARNLRKMLRQVVLTGTGRRAQLDGYTCAGKTGTAWKFDPRTKRIDSSKYVSSFIGMAPADDPEIVIAVVIDEPKAGARDGGMVAAPVFKAIAESVLPEMNIKRDGSAVNEMVAQEIPETTRSLTPGKQDGPGQQAANDRTSGPARPSVKPLSTTKEEVRKKAPAPKPSKVIAVAERNARCRMSMRLPSEKT